MATASVSTMENCIYCNKIMDPNDKGYSADGTACNNCMRKMDAAAGYGDDDDDSDHDAESISPLMNDIRRRVIDLDLTDLAQLINQCIETNPAKVKFFGQICELLEIVADRIGWPALAAPFGSQRGNVATITADLDICLVGQRLPNQLAKKHEKTSFLRKLTQQLKKMNEPVVRGQRIVFKWGRDEWEIRGHAKVPIARFTVEAPWGADLSVDVAYDNVDGIPFTQVIRAACIADRRYQSIAIALKCFMEKIQVLGTIYCKPSPSSILIVLIKVFQRLAGFAPVDITKTGEPTAVALKRGVGRGTHVNSGLRRGDVGPGGGTAAPGGDTAAPASAATVEGQRKSVYIRSNWNKEIDTRSATTLLLEVIDFLSDYNELHQTNFDVATAGFDPPKSATVSYVGKPTYIFAVPLHVTDPITLQNMTPRVTEKNLRQLCDAFDQLRQKLSSSPLFEINLYKTHSKNRGGKRPNQEQRQLLWQQKLQQETQQSEDTDDEL